MFCTRRPHPRAGVAQLVEQLIRNQQVLGSSPSAGSRFLTNSLFSLRRCPLIRQVVQTVCTRRQARSPVPVRRRRRLPYGPTLPPIGRVRRILQPARRARTCGAAGRMNACSESERTAEGAGRSQRGTSERAIYPIEIARAVAHRHGPDVCPSWRDLRDLIHEEFGRVLREQPEMRQRDVKAREQIIVALFNGLPAHLQGALSELRTRPRPGRNRTRGDRLHVRIRDGAGVRTAERLARSAGDAGARADTPRPAKWSAGYRAAAIACGRRGRAASNATFNGPRSPRANT